MSPFLEQPYTNMSRSSCPLQRPLTVYTTLSTRRFLTSLEIRRNFFRSPPMLRQLSTSLSQLFAPVYSIRHSFPPVTNSFFMSATLSGLIALENPTSLDDSPSTLSFDGQMWLSATHILTGVFQYYNVSNLSFPNVGQYFAWIHICNPFSVIFP